MKKENIEDDFREEIGKGKNFEDDINKPSKGEFEKGSRAKHKCKCLSCKLNFAGNRGERICGTCKQG